MHPRMCKIQGAPKRQATLSNVPQQAAEAGNIPSSSSFELRCILGHQQSSIFRQFFNNATLVNSSRLAEQQSPSTGNMLASSGPLLQNLGVPSLPSFFYSDSEFRQQQAQQFLPWLQQPHVHVPSQPEVLASCPNPFEVYSRSVCSSSATLPDCFADESRKLNCINTGLSRLHQQQPFSWQLVQNKSTLPSPPVEANHPLPVLVSKESSSTSRVKRHMPEIISVSNSELSSSEPEKPKRVIKRTRRSGKSKKHEATLDGERRVAIDFESIGQLGDLPQTYGKGALIVPDGVAGKYSAFGQRWRFSIRHANGPVICEDGVQRMCLSWSVTNINSGNTHTVVETPADAMKRDRDGKTLCNRVFRDALSLRASGLEAELRKTSDPTIRGELQCQLNTIQTKRFSEGPLFFGLRHCTLQNEMKKELEKRKQSQSQATG